MHINSLKKWFKDILSVLFIIFISSLFVMNSNCLQSLDGDFGDGAYSLFAGNANNISEGELPLWNQYIWGGSTAVGHSVMQAMYPVNILLEILFYNHDSHLLSFFMLAVQSIINISILGIGFYVLLRILKKTWFTCITITLLATFSSCSLRPFDWIYIFSGTCYLPLFIACLIKSYDLNQRNSLKFCSISGIILGLIGLASTSHGILINAAIMGILFINFLVWYKDKKEKLQLILRSLLIGGIGGGICSVSLLPFIDFLGKSFRYINDGVPTTGLHAMDYQYFVREALTIFDLENIILGGYGFLGIGLVLFLLFFIGLYVGRREKDCVHWYAVIITIGSILYSIGCILPSIIYYIPFFNNIRQPYLWACVSVVGMAMLASEGMDYIINFVFNKRDTIISSRLNTKFVYICVTLISIYLAVARNSTKLNILLIILLWLFIALLYKKNNKLIRRIAALIFLSMCCITTLINFNNFSNKRYSFREAANHINNIVEEYQSVLKALDTNQIENYRIAQWSAASSAYPSNLGSLLNKSDIVSYVNPYYESVMNIHYNWDVDKRFQMQNVKYVFATQLDSSQHLEWLKSLGLDEIARYTVNNLYDVEDKVGIIVYQNKHQLGNAWFVNDCIPYNSKSNIEDLNQVINSDDFNPQKSALVNTDTILSNETISDFETLETGEVDLIEFRANSIVFQTETTGKALLVTSEIYDDGWKIYIDGKKADLLEVNMTFKGVVVPKGNHEIKMLYFPDMFLTGMIIAIISIITSLFILFKRVSCGESNTNN